MSEHWKQDTAKCGIEAISVFFDRERETLYQRLNSRCDMMINHGLLDEIQGLLEMGLNFDTPGLNTVGYHEFQPFFQETTTLGECLSLMKQHTRNYAKRQWTWYRKCDFDLTYRLDTTTISEVVDDIIAHW
jgi:tRNA dimethylallyltransferase